MVKINLSRPWSYVTPAKTIDFDAGEHEVYQYVADQAEAEGVIAKDDADEGADNAGSKKPSRKAEE